MAAPCYIAYNGSITGLSAAFAGVTTGTSLKTMLQVQPGTPKLRIVEWGYSFSTLPTAFVNCELVVTSGAATVTTGASVMVSKYNDITGSATSVVFGTANTGFTASGEGTPATTRLLAQQFELGYSFKQQFPLGREPEVNASEFLRIRMTTSAAVTASCYVVWEE